MSRLVRRKEQADWLDTFFVEKLAKPRAACKFYSSSFAGARSSRHVSRDFCCTYFITEGKILNHSGLWVLRLILDALRPSTNTHKPYPSWKSVACIKCLRSIREPLRRLQFQIVLASPPPGFAVSRSIGLPLRLPHEIFHTCSLEKVFGQLARRVLIDPG